MGHFLHPWIKATTTKKKLQMTSSAWAGDDRGSVFGNWYPHHHHHVDVSWSWLHKSFLRAPCLSAQACEAHRHWPVECIKESFQRGWLRQWRRCVRVRGQSDELPRTRTPTLSFKSVPIPTYQENIFLSCSSAHKHRCTSANTHTFTHTLKVVLNALFFVLLLWDSREQGGLLEWTQSAYTYADLCLLLGHRLPQRMPTNLGEVRNLC